MKLYFVLVSPARAANVGAAARAMKTMGFDAMRLVVSRHFPIYPVCDEAGRLSAEALPELLERLPACLAAHPFECAVSRRGW